MKEKILLVSCDGLGRGGVQAVMMSIIRNLSDKYIFDVLIFVNELDYADEVLSHGGKIFLLPNYVGNNRLRKRTDILFRGILRYRKIKKILVENGPYRAIHCNNAYEAGICLKAAERADISIRIAHSHASIQRAHLVMHLLNKIYLRLIKLHGTELVGCSKEACQSFFGKKINANIIYNSYNENRFDPKKYEKSLIYSLTLLQIGSYCPNKNQKFSLDILKCITKRYPYASLIFVGFDIIAGYGEASLRSFVKDMGIEKNVHFYSCDADTPELLSQSAFMLFPSVQEGFGIVLVEAQAMGIKCYVSDSIPRLSNCGGCVYLSLADGAQKWADTIIEDYEKTQGKHCEYNCSKFSEKVVMEKYRNLYIGK